MDARESRTPLRIPEIVFELESLVQTVRALEAKCLEERHAQRTLREALHQKENQLHEVSEKRALLSKELAKKDMHIRKQSLKWKTRFEEGSAQHKALQEDYQKSKLRWNQQKQHLQQALEAAKSDHHHLKARLEQMEHTQNQLSAQNHQTQTQLVQTQLKSQHYVTTLQTLTQERDALLQEVQKIRASAQKTILQKEEALAQLKGESDAREKERAQMAHLAQYPQKVQALEAFVETLQGSQKKASRDKDIALHCLKQAELELSATKSELQQLKEKILVMAPQEKRAPRGSEILSLDF